MSFKDQRPLIVLNQVVFSYTTDSSRCVLNIPSWCVSDQEHVLLVGSSGSGKSTLLNLLSGLLIPSEGAMTVAGHTLEKMNGRERDKFRSTHIGYVAQNFNLIPYLSAADNIKLALHFGSNTSNKRFKVEIVELLAQLNISQSHWNRPISQLSIGQQQRIAIARAIINKPKIIIADEPTSSLDQSNRDNFMSILMEATKTHDTTLIFVSHDLSLSRYFDRIDSMSDINKTES